MNEHLNDILINYGGEIKTLTETPDAWKIGGWAVVFDSHDQSAMRDKFLKSTDFDFENGAQRSLYYHHGLDGTIKKAKLGTVTLEVKEAGVWYEGEIKKRTDFLKAHAAKIAEGIKNGMFGTSTGAPAHLVERKAITGGHEIDLWPIAEVSITPCPAEPLTTCISIKSLIVEDNDDFDGLYELKKFDPRQPRDDHGKWTDSAGRLSVGHAIAVMKHEGIADEKHHAAVKHAIESGTHKTREDVLKHIDGIHAGNKSLPVSDSAMALHEKTGSKTKVLETAQAIAKLDGHNSVELWHVAEASNHINGGGAIGNAENERRQNAANFARQNKKLVEKHQSGKTISDAEKLAAFNPSHHIDNQAVRHQAIEQAANGDVFGAKETWRKGYEEKAPIRGDVAKIAAVDSMLKEKPSGHQMERAAPMLELGNLRQSIHRLYSQPAEQSASIDSLHATTGKGAAGQGAAGHQNTTGSVEGDERLNRYREKAKRGYGMTAGDEKSFTHHQEMEKADPSKWESGHGVGHRVEIGRGGQISRGFQIHSVDPQSKTAVIRQVADTGLTTSGGNYDRMPMSVVHIADLVRDKKYDSPSIGLPSKPQPPPPQPRREQQDSNAPRPHTYHMGDKAEYTGKTQMIHGALFHELEIMEGRNKGKTAVTMRAADGSNPEDDKRKQEKRKRAEGFDRVQEATRWAEGRQTATDEARRKEAAQHADAWAKPRKSIDDFDTYDDDNEIKHLADLNEGLHDSPRGLKFADHLSLLRDAVDEGNARIIDWASSFDAIKAGRKVSAATHAHLCALRDTMRDGLDEIDAFLDEHEPQGYEGQDGQDSDADELGGAKHLKTQQLTERLFFEKLQAQQAGIIPAGAEI